MAVPRTKKSKPRRVICHVSDLHLGYRRYSRVTKDGFNQREVDVTLSFQESINRIVARKPDLVVVSGDLFHSVRPSNIVLGTAVRQFRRLVRETKAPVVIVAGNHDTPRRVDTGSPLALFADLEGVYTALDEAQWFTFPERDIAVYAVPHAAWGSRAGLILRAREEFPYNILVTHAQVTGAWSSEIGGADVTLSELAPHEWDYVALGHVHVHRDLATNVSYAGATDHTSLNIWSESGEGKGFLEVALPGPRRTFFPLTSPRSVVALPPIEADGLEPAVIQERIVERIGAVAGGLAGKIVRLEVRGLSREAARALDHRQLRKLRAEALHCALELRTEDRQPAATPIPAARTSRRLSEELATFVEQRVSDAALRERVQARLGSTLERLMSNDEAPRT